MKSSTFEVKADIYDNHHGINVHVAINNHLGRGIAHKIGLKESFGFDYGDIRLDSSIRNPFHWIVDYFGIWQPYIKKIAYRYDLTLQQHAIAWDYVKKKLIYANLLVYPKNKKSLIYPSIIHSFTVNSHTGFQQDFFDLDKIPHLRRVYSNALYPGINLIGIEYASLKMIEHIEKNAIRRGWLKEVNKIMN